MIGSRRGSIAANGRFAANPSSSSPDRNPEFGLIHALLENRWRVKAMQKLIEFYEMASLNTAALGDGEKLAILEARRALRKFARAMESFKAAPMEAALDTDTTLRVAAWQRARELPSN